MPIHDANCIFSDSQAITATAASTNALNVMELLGKGQPVRVNIQVTVDFATLTSLNVKLQQSANGSTGWADVDAGETILLAGLTAGAKYGLNVLPRNVTQPWIRLYYTVAGSNATAGKVFAALPFGEEDWYGTGQFIDKGVTEA